MPDQKTGFVEDMTFAEISRQLLGAQMRHDQMLREMEDQVKLSEAALWVLRRRAKELYEMENPYVPTLEMTNNLAKAILKLEVNDEPST